MEEIQKDNQDGKEKVKEETQKKAVHDKKDKKKTIVDKFNEIKGEFRKIIWPSKEDLAKQTCTVIVTSLLVGAIIVAMDFVCSQGLMLFSSLVSK